MEMEGQPEASKAKMVGQKKRIGARVLAEALLEYTLKPAGPELERECSPHFLDEFLSLKVFTVDYVLGLKSVNNPAFASVRQHYHEEIDTCCDGSKTLRVFRDTMVSRFAIYTEACNTDNLTPRKYKGKRLMFWELGKAFSSLASDTQPWRPSALQVVLHANTFLSHMKGLVDFLEQYEVASP
jgi:hypothetical protein